MPTDYGKLAEYSAPFFLLLINFITFIIFYFRLMRKKGKHQALATEIQQQGIQISGSILKRYQTLTESLLIYSYEYQEKKYIQIQNVGLEEYQRVNEGSNVTIVCLPDNPQKAILADFKAVSFLDITTSGCLVLTIIYGLVLILSIIIMILTNLMPMPSP